MTTKSALSSGPVTLDPDDVKPPDIRDKFHAPHREFDSVFDPHYKGYNGAVDPFQARVNMGPVLPPQRKGRVPQYSRDQFDVLEGIGVFRKPEDVDITVEYVNHHSTSRSLAMVLALSQHSQMLVGTVNPNPP